ncbi:MAG: HepT-like ribonuclease domain-containing protein [Terracidiphilus sp.]|jgi:uncharacterized protein with HEPN domain
MPFEDSRSNLGDILQSILLIEQFVMGMDFEAYRRDEKTQAAVERKMLIISEAAIRLKDEAEALCPDVPWRDIRGIGNWLRHQYDRVEVETVWNTIQDDLPPLKAAVEPVLTPPEPSSRH